MSWIWALCLSYLSLCFKLPPADPLRSCVGSPPAGHAISAHVHCLCSILGRDPSRSSEPVPLFTLSDDFSPHSEWNSKSVVGLQVIRYSLLLSVFSGLTFCGSPVTRMLWTSVSPKRPHPEMLTLESSLWSLHGLSPYFLQGFGYMSLF